MILQKAKKELPFLIDVVVVVVGRCLVCTNRVVGRWGVI